MLIWSSIHVPEQTRCMLSAFLLALILPTGLFDSGQTTAASPSGPGEQKRSSALPVPDDTLTLAEVREMIVGTWIEDVAQKIGNHERGGLRWVFTEGGTVRKYEDGEPYGTHSYAVVGEHKGTQAPEDIAGYLKFTDQDGDVRYMTLTSITRGSKRPHLYVKTHGMAGNTESLYFVPARLFE